MMDPSKDQLPGKLLESVIEEKKSHIDDVITARVDKLSARQEAYKRIVECAKTQMGVYYERFPERAVDERGKQVEEESLAGLRTVFDVLDDYIIAFKDTQSPEASTQAEATPVPQKPSKEETQGN